MPPAIVLVAHGSPDPDWRRPLEQVRDRMRRAQPERVIELAYQAYTEPTLEQVVERLWAAGISDAVVVAAFLSPGGRHIKQDLPDQVSAAAARYPGVRLRLVEGALGADAGVVEALARAAFLAAGALTPSGGAL